MKNIQKVYSVFVACFILMTHVFAFIHSFDHSNEHPDNNISKEITYKDSQSTDDCNICDIYLNSEIPVLEESNYSLPLRKVITSKIIPAENQLTSIVLFHKKSRSPPYIFS
ncbi:MAG: hypothetical protein MK202_07665 [Tenacibaculum sp.]|nr:hypothetical protein [Tenacibaculum sp.]